MSGFGYAEGATAPAVLLQFLRDGQPVPITGATIVATVGRPGFAPIVRPMAIRTANLGVASLAWQAGDLVLPPLDPDPQTADVERVTYKIDVAITWPDGTVEYPPEAITFTVRRRATSAPSDLVPG